jgi:hypothetical protein
MTERDPYVALALAAEDFMEKSRQAMDAWDIDDAWRQYEDSETTLKDLVQKALEL